MTSVITTQGTTDAPPDSRAHVRLRLKPRGPVTGFVDGGWWPRSRDLLTELPALMAVLAIPLGRVESVSYNLDDWRPAPRKITVDGAVVRLSGYRAQRRDTVDVLGAQVRVTLLVVPPTANVRSAHAALMTSGHRGNTDAVETLLSATVSRPAGDEPVSL